MSWANCGNDSVSVCAGEQICSGGSGVPERKRSGWGDQRCIQVRDEFCLRVRWQARLAPANAQLGIVGTEMEREVAAGCSAVAVHLGTSPEMLTGAEGANANIATSVVSVVRRLGWKTEPCTAFDVEVAGQETNTTRGVSSNSGVGTGVRLPFRAGMGTGTEMGAETNGLAVAGGMRAACSQERT